MTHSVLLTLIVTGCATGYGPKGLLGGYENKQIGDHLYEVKFHGNQHTPKEKTLNFLLYRCAELTLEEGFTHFIILENQSYADVHIQEPEYIKPWETRTSLSGGVMTIVKPDFGKDTVSEDYKAIYIISTFNDSNPNFKKFEYQRQDAASVIKKLKAEIN